MRRLLLCTSLALCLALPNGAGAQDADVADEEAPAQEEAIGDEGGYEPDQRGVEDDGDGGGGESTGGDDQAVESPDYEPDQRGWEDGYDDDDTDVEEEAERDSMPAPTAESAEVYAAEGGADVAARRGLGFDLQLHLGGGLTGFDAFGGNNVVQSDQTGEFGGSFGLTAGLRLGALTLGPRLSFTAEPRFLLGAVGLDIQLALTNGAIAPVLRLSVSYAFLAALSDPLPSQNDPQGVWTELGIGVRAYIAGPLFLGGEVSGGYLALFRDEVPTCTDPCDGDDLDLSEGGATHGATFRFHLDVGLSF